MVGNLRVLSYNMWWLVNLILLLPLGLFGVSWSSKFLVLDDILIFAFMGLLMVQCKTTFWWLTVVRLTIDEGWTFVMEMLDDVHLRIGLTHSFV